MTDHGWSELPISPADRWKRCPQRVADLIAIQCAAKNEDGDAGAHEDQLLGRAPLDVHIARDDKPPALGRDREPRFVRRTALEVVDDQLDVRVVCPRRFGKRDSQFLRGNVLVEDDRERRSCSLRRPLVIPRHHAGHLALVDGVVPREAFHRIARSMS
jgi:hypothetical protein